MKKYFVDETGELHTNVSGAFCGYWKESQNISGCAKYKLFDEAELGLVGSTPQEAAELRLKQISSEIDQMYMALAEKRILTEKIENSYKI